MKDLVPIKVECHSGFKTDEYPKYFYWDNIRFDIKEIIDRWYQVDQNFGFPPANYFKIKTTDEKIYILKHDFHSNKWYLLIYGESMNL